MDSTGDDDIRALWKEWLDKRSLDVRNQLFEHYFPWCREVASGLFKRYNHYLLEWQDYVSLTSMATLKCIETFDATVGVPFEGYAYPRIRGNILNELSRNVKANDVHAHVSYPPSQIADEAKSSENDSLTTIVDLAIDTAFSILLGIGCLEPIPPDQYYETEQTAFILATLADQLDDRERFVVKSYYFQQFSFKEIAIIMDVSPARISQIHKRAISQLREVYESLY